MGNINQYDAELVMLQNELNEQQTIREKYKSKFFGDARKFKKQATYKIREIENRIDILERKKEESADEIELIEIELQKCK